MTIKLNLTQAIFIKIIMMNVLENENETEINKKTAEDIIRKLNK